MISSPFPSIFMVFISFFRPGLTEFGGQYMIAYILYFRRSLAGGFGVGTGIGYTWEESDLPMAGISLMCQ